MEKRNQTTVFLVGISQLITKQQCIITLWLKNYTNMCMQTPVYLKSPIFMLHNPYIPDSDAPIFQKKREKAPIFKDLIAPC